VEIKVRVSRFWKDEERLVKRIARAVCSSDENVHKKDSGYPWALDGSNDWWCDHLDLETREIKITYRYGGGGNAKKMEALRVFLQWTLGGDNDDE